MAVDLEGGFEQPIFGGSEVIIRPEMEQFCVSE